MRHLDLVMAVCCKDAVHTKVHFLWFTDRQFYFSGASLAKRRLCIRSRLRTMAAFSKS